MFPPQVSLYLARLLLPLECLREAAAARLHVVRSRRHVVLDAVYQLALLALSCGARGGTGQR